MKESECEKCNRQVAETRAKGDKTRTPAKAVGHHTGYGCDTGCCGMETVILDAEGALVCRSKFDFMHDESTALEFAAKHGVPLEGWYDPCKF